MLHIKQKFHIGMPSLKKDHAKPVQFVPVVDDDDELTQAIATDGVQHDNNWELNGQTDTSELDGFWTKVEDDIEHDPKWVRFSEDGTPDFL